MSVETEEDLRGLGSAGSGALRETSERWTVSTAEGALSAQVEETIMIRHGAPLVLTA